MLDRIKHPTHRRRAGKVVTQHLVSPTTTGSFIKLRCRSSSLTDPMLSVRMPTTTLDTLKFFLNRSAVHIYHGARGCIG